MRVGGLGSVTLAVKLTLWPSSGTRVEMPDGHAWGGRQHDLGSHKRER